MRRHVPHDTIAQSSILRVKCSTSDTQCPISKEDPHDMSKSPLTPLSEHVLLYKPNHHNIHGRQTIPLTCAADAHRNEQLFLRNRQEKEAKIPI